MSEESSERRRVEPLSVESFSTFAGNIYERLGSLEAHSERVEDVLFVSTEDRPSLESLAKTVDTHIKAMCGWAAALKRVVLIVTGACALVAAVMAAIRVFS